MDTQPCAKCEQFKQHIAVLVRPGQLWNENVVTIALLVVLLGLPCACDVGAVMRSSFAAWLCEGAQRARFTMLSAGCTLAFLMLYRNIRQMWILQKTGVSQA